MDDRALLRTAADRLDALAARTTAGDWRAGGLLASRPEVIAHHGDGRAPSTWPRRAPAPRPGSPPSAPPSRRPWPAWLRAAADAPAVEPAATAVARVLLERLP